MFYYRIILIPSYFCMSKGCIINVEILFQTLPFQFQNVQLNGTVRACYNWQNGHHFSYTVTFTMLMLWEYVAEENFGLLKFTGNFLSRSMYQSSVMFRRLFSIQAFGLVGILAENWCHCCPFIVPLQLGEPGLEALCFGVIGFSCIRTYFWSAHHSCDISRNLWEIFFKLYRNVNFYLNINWFNFTGHVSNLQVTGVPCAPSLWTQYPNNALKDFLQKCILWLRDKLRRSKVQSQGHCSLMWVSLVLIKKD